MTFVAQVIKVDESGLLTDKMEIFLFYNICRNSKNVNFQKFYFISY